MTQAKVIAYSQIREIEEGKRDALIAGARSI